MSFDNDDDEPTIRRSARELARQQDEAIRLRQEAKEREEQELLRKQQEEQQALEI